MASDNGQANQMPSSFADVHMDETAQVAAQLLVSLACIPSEPPMPNGEEEEYVALSRDVTDGN
jgi:hypothetical protein